MRRIKKCAGSALALALAASMGMTGCSGTDNSATTAADTTAAAETTTEAAETTEAPEETDAPEEETTTEEEPTVDETKYIDLAVNVYYNDGDNGYYANEAGEVTRIYTDGQYTLSFDCDKDLSQDAIDAGVTSLTNLTAIYIKDMGVEDGEQSPLKAANIMYDSVVVDGTELTITQTEPKSAFKSSGVFDTNDPVNGWDGSCIEEIDTDTSNHIANFNSVENPKTISITFTLSDMDYVGATEDDSDDDDVVSDNTYENTLTLSDVDFSGMSATEFTKYMGNGINLGNTMEAYGRSSLGTGASVSSYETYWGQPVTTEAMVKGMKNCGFDSIRIPIAWTNAMDYTDGDYTIKTEYMDRIQELVDYAIDSEMIVIINDHWDGGWWAMFGSSEQTDVDNAFAMYEEMWSQICERFKDYGDMLVFESANEELGDSLNDNTDWAASGALSKDGLYEMTNKINQTFVDLVRKSGGNNENRFLLIAGYNTDIDKTCDDRFVMPTDTAENKLMVSVHYYSPWNYAGASTDARWGLKSEYEYMDEQFEKMTKFTDAGYGVVIGEYAALPYWEDNVCYIKTNTTEFTKSVLDNCDKYNLVPMLWSCNDLYVKDTLNMATDELTELFTSRCYAEELAAGDDYMTDMEASMQEDRDNAIEQWPDVKTVEEGVSYAWIMWNGGAGTYSVGDTYNPSDNTEGITATDVEVTGAGEYTVSLDFAGGNDGLTFAALAVGMGEDNFPGYYIEIKSITVDGTEITPIADYYTSSDDEHCTRVNLLNEWVSSLPDDARRLDGDLTNASPVILDKTQLVGIKNITITFDYVAAN